MKNILLYSISALLFFVVFCGMTALFTEGHKLSSADLWTALITSLIFVPTLHYFNRFASNRLKVPEPQTLIQAKALLKHDNLSL